MTIPAGSLAFSGFGDAPMKFLSPTGTALTAPVTAPDCGPGCNGLLASTVTSRVLQVGGSGSLTGVTIFDIDFAVAATPTGTGTGRGIGRDAAGHFYGSLGTTVSQFSETAETTTWDVSAWFVNTSFLDHFAVNPAATILYGAAHDTFAGPVTPQKVYAWDLVGNASLGVFADDSAAAFVPQGVNCVMTLGTGDVLVGFSKYLVAGVGYVKHYNAAGTVLHTYALTGTNPSPAVLTPGLDDTTFWVSFYSGAATASGVTIAELAIGTGTVLHSFDPDDGAFEFDGPFCVVRAGSAPPIPPAPPGAIEPIRRLRQAPVLWDGAEGKRLKFPGFELLTEAGGPRDTDVSMPIVLQWSDDGGHSWGHEHRNEGARIGEHRYRYRWLRLGQARNRVFRVVCSADAKIVLIDALLTPDPVQGSS